MVRSYDDVVQVREPEAAGMDRTSAGEASPQAFLWKGRLYVVRDVLAHWYERRAWWTESAALAVQGQSEQLEEGELPGADREIWRVEASAGRQAGTGVYDLCRNPSGPESWRLLRVAD